MWNVNYRVRRSVVCGRMNIEGSSSFFNDLIVIILHLSKLLPLSTSIKFYTHRRNLGVVLCVFSIQPSLGINLTKFLYSKTTTGHINSVTKPKYKLL